MKAKQNILTDKTFLKAQELMNKLRTHETAILNIQKDIRYIAVNVAEQIGIPPGKAKAIGKDVYDWYYFIVDAIDTYGEHK